MRFGRVELARRVGAAAVVAVVSVGAAGGCGAARREAGASVTSPPARATVASTSTTSPPPTRPPTTTPQTTVAPQVTFPAPPPTVAGAGVAVGDSVLEDVRLYAPATLEGRDISIDAKVGRQWGVGVDLLASLKGRGRLPPVVIVALGSNGQVGPAQFDQMMQACAGAKRVVFMTVTGPLIGNNPVIAAGVARYPGTAALADWNGLAAAHPDWFAPDHVHVGPAGATALGNLLASLS